MKFNYKIDAFLIFLVLLFASCGSNTFEDPISSGNNNNGFFSNIPPKTIKTLALSIISSDITQGTALVQVRSTLEETGKEPSSFVFYDNAQLRELDNGTVNDGQIRLDAGRHVIQVCVTPTKTKCTQEEIIIVGDTVDASSYTKLPVGEKIYGLSNNGTDLVYATENGQVYTLNTSSQTSTFLTDTAEEINGLYYTSTTLYYSTIPSGDIIRFTLSNSNKVKLSNIPFPDGLDFYNGRLYSVTNDRSGILTILDTNGQQIGTLNTGIDDIVGLSHTSNFLYILSEDGHIYQTHSRTGKSSKVFSNAGLFEQGNSVKGLEAITILNNRIYVSYINDKSIYLININLSDYE